MTSSPQFDVLGAAQANAATDRADFTAAPGTAVGVLGLWFGGLDVGEICPISAWV